MLHSARRKTALCKNCNSHPAPNHVRRSTWRGSYLCAYPACVPGIALRARRNVSMCRNQPPSVPPASPLAVEYRVDYPPCTGCASFRLIKVAKQLSLSPCVLFDEAVQVVTRPTPVRERLDTFRLEHPSKCDCLAVTVELREWIVPRLDVRVSHSIGRNCCGCKASIHQSLVRSLLSARAISTNFSLCAYAIHVL